MINRFGIALIAVLPFLPLCSYASSLFLVSSRRILWQPPAFKPAIDATSGPGTNSWFFIPISTYNIVWVCFIFKKTWNKTWAFFLTTEWWYSYVKWNFQCQNFIFIMGISEIVMLFSHFRDHKSDRMSVFMSCSETHATQINKQKSSMNTDGKLL